MTKEYIFEKALNLEFLDLKEAVFIYNEASLGELMFVANLLRKKIKTNGKVTWQIDRNVNITNVCLSQCKFCNYYRKYGSEEAYTTTIEQYTEKIKVLFEHGGDQLLLQGGLHPKLGLDFYTDLFRQLKKIEPRLKLHALGPPEVAHIARLSKLSLRETLEKLVEAGLDSLPGAGAEILVDRVRNFISPNKCNTETWLNVMREAHKMGLVTSATMMMGHLETLEERIEHLLAIRQVQSEKPKDAPGFISFIPWPFQDSGTELQTKMGVNKTVSPEEYIRTIAISRIVLSNVQNIQASWLTVGKATAQMCLHAGANDFGSIMIEENVVSSAGAHNSFDAKGIQAAIKEAGFEPQLRNQRYEFLIN